MVHPRVEALFYGFEQSGIRWCVLRLPLEPGNSTGDVDLLIDRPDVQRMQVVMTRMEFVELPGRSPGLHFLSYHLPTDCWIWVHVITELSFGPYAVLQTHAEAGCLDRRRRNGVMVMLASDDSFWVLLLHCLLDKGSIAPHHRMRLQELAARRQPDCTLASVIAAVCPDGWNPARIMKCVYDANWAQLEEFAPSLKASWMRRDRIGTLRLLRQRASRIINKLVNLPRSRGLGVALLGPDGAGKTTLIAGIQESFILPVQSVYMGLTGGLLPYVDRLTVPLFVIPGRLCIFWCRYLVAQYHQARGRLVIFDRYIYDSAIPTPYPLNWLGRAYRWIDGHSVPAPDLVLVLDAPGDVMYQRKGEYSPDQLEDWRHHFLALQDRITRLEIVDTSQAKDKVRADVIDRIWRQYVARWKKN